MNPFPTFLRYLTYSASLLALATASITPAIAANRIFNLHLHNIDSRPVTMTIMTTGHNCYEGSPGLGQVFENVPPGQQRTITLARVQGHGCNGRQGEFGIQFEPGVGSHQNIQYFNFDNGGSLGLSEVPNSYPGKLSAKQADESYTYTTFQRPKVTAGRAQGKWQFLCQGYCNDTVSKEITNSTTREKTQSSETTSAISVALEAGLDFPGGGSAKTTVTASQERKVGQSMSESIARGETNTRAKTIIFTPEQMRDLGIFAVWQWVAETTLSTGDLIIVNTDKISCTADGEPPTYLPGSVNDIRACSGGLAAPVAAAPVAAAPPVASNQADPRGFELFWDGEKVNGPETVSFTMDQAKQSCTQNLRPGIKVECRFNGNTFHVDPHGFELFWDGKKVNGPETVSFTMEQAKQSCTQNLRPGIKVECRFNGNTFHMDP